MNKILLSLFVLLGSGAYVWAERGWIAARDEAEARSAEAEAAAAEAAVAEESLTSESTEPKPAVTLPTQSRPDSPASAEPTQSRSTAPMPDRAQALLDEHAAAMATAALATGPFHDGKYTGPKADAYYGYVEVVIEVKGGKIVSARAAHSPRSSQTSRYLSSRSVSKLNKQAISIQNANVDVVTGATLTSKAYAVSLVGALEQARQ